MKSVMFVAAEASSAHFAIKLIEKWKSEGQQLKFFGVGTQEMEQLGFERLGQSEEMAIVGAAEIISHYPLLKRVFQRLLEEAEKRRPQVVILMDYPEFNLMLAKQLHQRGIPCVYYISPQVWAWRKGRVHTIKKYCRKVLLLFPFEVEFYKKFNVPYEFVGHPLLDELDPRYYDESYLALEKSKRGFAKNEVVIGLMPGSRRLELKNLFAIQLKVAERLVRKYPHVRICILLAPTVSREQIQPYLEDVRIPYVVLKDDPFKMIAMTDIVLAASGTATLMVGLLHKPMVIMYKMSWLTALLGKLIVKGFFGLPNLISGRQIVPELFQWDCHEERVYFEVTKFLDDPEYLKRTLDDLKLLQSKLGDRGATARVARALDEFLK